MAKKNNPLLNAIKEKSDQAAAIARTSATEKLISTEVVHPSSDLVQHEPIKQVAPIEKVQPNENIHFSEEDRDHVSSLSVMPNEARLSLSNKERRGKDEEQVRIYRAKVKKTFEFDSSLVEVVENILRNQPGRSFVDFVETAMRGYTRKLERENGGSFPVIKDYRKRR